MRRTASEIIRNLEIRVARLEGRTAAPRGMRNLDALRYEQMGAGSVADAIFADADSVRDWLYNEYELGENDYNSWSQTRSAVANTADHTIILESYSDGSNTPSISGFPRTKQPFKQITIIKVDDDGGFETKRTFTNITGKQYAQAVRGLRQLIVTMI